LCAQAVKNANLQQRDNTVEKTAFAKAGDGDALGIDLQAVALLRKLHFLGSILGKLQSNGDALIGEAVLTAVVLQKGYQLILGGFHRTALCLRGGQGEFAGGQDFQILATTCLDLLGNRLN